jgi:3',5'-cyclic AMP phosphodiesterase CpdA
MSTHVVAHLSDLHLDGGPAASARARHVMAYLESLPADLEAVVVTGDLTADGRPEEYAQVAELIATSRHPVLTCPGNHDARQAYRAGLPDQVTGTATGTGTSTDAAVRDDAPLNRVHRTDGMVFAMCDSTIPGEHAGRLDDVTLAWLEDVLRDTPPRIPVVVALHHFPEPLHSPVLDGMRLLDGDRLAAVLGRFPNVVAVLCGHAHTAAATTFAGHPLRVAPGVFSTLTLPWEEGDLLDPARPPGLAFHVVDGDAPAWRVVTHYRTLAHP